MPLPPSWLPYSTDSDFHDFAFVFVSWVGGGNPPWAEAKCLGLHRGQKKARQGWFLFKIGFLCAWKGSNCKIYDIKGLKTHQNCSFFTMAVQLANWGADTFSFFGGIFGQPSFLETCSVDSQLNSDRFSFFYFLDWTSESRETKFLVRLLLNWPVNWGAASAYRGSPPPAVFHDKYQSYKYEKHSREIC